MPFDRILEQVTESHDTRLNTLTDGQFSASYRDVPLLIAQVERFLGQQGITSQDCLGVESINSLAGAILLLALFRKGHSFALAPPAVNDGDLKPTPHFCRYRLTVVPAARNDTAAFSAGRFLRIESNARYNGGAAPAARLYLRTSGSMGASKIVVHSHEKLFDNARNCVGKYGFKPASRAVIPVPVAHMYGLGAEFLPAVIAGASIDIQEKTNLLKYLDREKRFQPTIAFVTPGICDMLRKGFKAARLNYEAVVVSGQHISEELFCALDPLVGRRLINQYGSTEMGATAACDLGDKLDRRATTIGKPMPGVQLRVETREVERDAAPGVGALYCRHPYGFEGYVDENGEWLRQSSPDDWYRTGDVASEAPDGLLAVLGRADASVNRGGYLVLLSDIERVLEKLETLGEVAVIAGNSEDKRGQRIAAFCVPRPGVRLDGAQLRARCFDVLPHYAIPDEVRVIETMPILASGKVDRRTLAALVE